MLKIVAGLVVILLVGALLLYVIVLRPIEKFQPTGQYRVGAQNFDFEFSSAILAHTRKLNIRAWYPSHQREGELNPVSSKRVSAAALKIFNMPEFLAQEELSLSFKDAAIATGKFPVVIFNHGFASFAEQNTVNMQELASNGYVVLAISHPGTSLVTEYRDGTFVSHDAGHPAYVDFADFENFSARSAKAFQNALNEIEGAADYAQYWSAMRGLAQGPAFKNYQGIIRQWVEDTNVLVDAISGAALEQFPARLAQGLDTAKIGLMGHSLGGITVNAVSLSSPDISAVLNLDGPFAYDVPVEQSRPGTPTCFLMAAESVLDATLRNAENINLPLMEHSGQPGCYAVFAGARHMNFTDLNYVSFLKLLPLLGPVNQKEFGLELNNVMVHFFDRYLKQMDVPFEPVTQNIIEYREF